VPGAAAAVGLSLKCFWGDSLILKRQGAKKNTYKKVKPNLIYQHYYDASLRVQSTTSTIVLGICFIVVTSLTVPNPSHCTTGSFHSTWGWSQQGVDDEEEFRPF